MLRRHEFVQYFVDAAYVLRVAGVDLGAGVHVVAEDERVLQDVRGREALVCVMPQHTLQQVAKLLVLAGVEGPDELDG